MTVNGGEVLDRIVADVAFVTELANAGCITWSQREHLNNIIQPRDRNERLTEFLTRRSVADFRKFISVLAKEQEILVPLFLTDGGALFAINFTVSGGPESKPPNFLSSSKWTDCQYFYHSRTHTHTHLYTHTHAGTHTHMY